MTWGATETGGGRETVIRIHLKKKKIKFKKKKKNPVSTFCKLHSSSPMYFYNCQLYCFLKFIIIY